MKLVELLPEYYRENPQRMGPLLEIAEEMFEDAGFQLRRARGRLSDDFIFALRGRLFPRATDRRGEGHLAGGTRREFRRWFRLHGGGVLPIWSGFEVSPAGADRVRLRRSRRPAAVVVWGRKCSSELPRPPVIPRDMVPLRTRLQIILSLSEEEDVSISCHGRILKAEITWDSQGLPGHRAP